jgi:hypothetical protein
MRNFRSAVKRTQELSMPDFAIIPLKGGEVLLSVFEIDVCD